MPSASGATSLFCCRTCKRKAGDAEALAVSATHSRGNRTRPWVGTRASRLLGLWVRLPLFTPALCPPRPLSLSSQPSFPSCNPGAGQDRAGARPPQEGKCFQAMNVRVPFGGEAGRLPEPQVTSWTHKLSPSISTSSRPPPPCEQSGLLFARISNPSRTEVGLKCPCLSVSPAQPEAPPEAGGSPEIRGKQTS